jgi:class 3 adenylate cyclase/tetratricopeptide (TPR) repeat protein
VVTVLFADLVGFTGLAEARDPERVKNLVDRCFQLLVADIEAFGGRVDKIIGDAIVALFGAPVAHEDDAERAVRAALAMQATLDRMAAEVDDAIRMRIGVNTGEVLVGALRAGGDYTAMGDVVNLASRLQVSAEVGEVLVGPATHAATNRVIGYRSAGEMLVRGRGEAVAAWVAVEALVPPGHRPDRGRAPLVGRDAEMAVLERSVEVAVTHGRALLGVVLGEAGVGKSRLGEELATRAERDHGALVLEGRCVPYGEANVWWPIADALRHGCGIRSTDPDDVAVTAAEQTIASIMADSPVEERERTLTGLLHLMGYDSPLRSIDPGRAREAATTALVTFAQRATEHRMVVFVLSDLHWADDLVLDILDTLVERLADRRFVLLATARRQLDERWSPPVGRHNQVRLTLDPLGDEAATEMLRSLLGEDPGDALTSALLDRAGGNPFFLEELVALLGDPGPGTQAHPALADQTGELPDTLRGLVAARLDGLGAAERRVLECCAILGRKGPVSAVTTMAGYYLQPDAVAPALDSLVAKELLSLAGHGEEALWAFRSDLVREVAYGTLTKGDRARGHAGIAGWMERHEDLEREANIDRLAKHLTRAAEIVAELGEVDGVPPHTVERALEWIERAAARADAGDVPLVAARLYADGLGLLGLLGADGADPLRRSFLLGRARALAALHDLDGARADAEVACEAAAAAGDTAAEARALLVLADVAQKSTRWDEADELLDQASARFVELGDQGGEAESLRLRGFGALFQADHDRATELLEAARARFESLGDRRGEAWALQNLAWCAFSTGHPAEAEVRLHTAAGVFEEIGDLGGLGWAQGLLAYTRFMLGHTEEAEALAEAVRAEAAQRGDRWGMGMMLVLTASVRLWTGRTCSAVERAEESVAVFERIGDEFGRAQSTAVLGRSLVATGRIEEGMAALSSLAEGSGWAATREGVIGRTAELGAAVHLGDVERAAAILSRDGADPTATGAGALEGEQAVSTALHLLQRGDPEAGVALLERVAAAGDAAVSGGYLGAARSLVLAASGDRAGASEAVDAVSSDPRSSYLDRIMALLAQAGLHAAGGDHASAADVLGRAAEVTAATEDVVTVDLVRLAREVIGGDRPTSGDADGARPLARRGWATALARVAGVDPRARTGAAP